MIKHLLLDVDGVLNTGQFLYDSRGKAYKIFGPHDKDGLKLIKALGLTINFISSDKNGFAISKARIVKDWGFSEHNLTLVSEEDRLNWVTAHYNLDELAYIGDGYYDAPILSCVKIGIAPNSARKEAKAAAKYITESNAGEGAVLDACLIIKSIMENNK